MTQPNPTLIINRSSSKCANCNRGASPTSLLHDVVYEYSADSGTNVGCGIVWTQVRSDYVGLQMEKVCAEMRPDLVWVGIDEDEFFGRR